VIMEGDCAEITNFAGQKPHDKWLEESVQIFILC
jgi:hypothetical protein